MARGYDEHRERQELISRLGKPLARRSGSRCELCGAGGVPLSVFVVPPEDDVPSEEGALFLCDECRLPIENPRQFNGTRWHFLTECVWSELPVVQVMAVRLLRRLRDNEPWAASALEDLYLDDEIEEWVSLAV